MIKVILHEEVRSPTRASKWRYAIWRELPDGKTVEWRGSGLSREPLLDACRQIKRMGDLNQHQQIGLYRPGRDRPDLSCSVEVGADLTVRENEKVGPVLVKWKPRDFGA